LTLLVTRVRSVPSAFTIMIPPLPPSLFANATLVPSADQAGSWAEVPFAGPTTVTRLEPSGFAVTAAP
jgi:hypothetical protein